jgi:tetratricopeptide (TPR) repeat protein
MMERFGSSLDHKTAQWTVTTCVVLPDSVDAWNPVVQWAENTFAKDSKNLNYLITAAAALYRSGRYQDAFRRLTEAEAAFKPIKDDKLEIFLAMATSKLGRHDEAKERLTKAKPSIEKPIAKTTDLLAPTWYRQYTLQVLLREAEALVNSKDAETAKPK